MLGLIALAWLWLIGVPLFALLAAAGLAAALDAPQGGWAAASVAAMGSKLADNPTLAALPSFLLTAQLLTRAQTAQRIRAAAGAWLGQRAVTELAAEARTVALAAPACAPLIIIVAVLGLPPNEAMLAASLPALLALTGVGMWALRLRGATAERGPASSGRAALSAVAWELALVPLLFLLFAAGRLALYEVGALAAGYVIAIGLIAHRDLTRAQLGDLALRAVLGFGVIALVLAGAIAVDAAFARAEWPERFAQTWTAVASGRASSLFVVALWVLLAGVVLGIVGAAALVPPLFAPYAYRCGVEPHQLAVVIALGLAASERIRPTTLRASIDWMFGRPSAFDRSSLRPFAWLLVVLLLVIAVPALTGYLPEHLGAVGF